MNTNTARIEDLRDIQNVKIDLTMPIEKRRDSYIEQIQNPYHFKYNDMIVRLEFAGEISLEEKILNHFIKK